MAVSALAAVAAVGTVSSAQQQRKAAKNQRRAQQTQQRIADVQAARERRDQVRQARVAQANLLSQQVAQGVQTTSGGQTGVAQVGQQAAGNLSFLDTVGDLSRQASIFNIQAAQAQSRAATAGAISGLALQGSSLFAPTTTQTTVANPQQQ